MEFLQGCGAIIALIAAAWAVGRFVAAPLLGWPPDVGGELGITVMVALMFLIAILPGGGGGDHPEDHPGFGSHGY
jgi:hypothetical protein